MKVLTLDNESFGAACVNLQKAVEDARFVPDMVLGIESGGRYVAEKVFTNVPHCYVALHRPSTDKKIIIRNHLTFFVYVFYDFIRITISVDNTPFT